MRDVDLETLTNFMQAIGQDNRDVEEVKVEGGDDEEVDRHHAGEVIAEESNPVLGRGPADSWDHVFGDGALGNGLAKLQQFTVDAGIAPQRVRATHVADQINS